MNNHVYEKIYKIVQQIPKGRVATYGQIARLVNRPRNARQIGYALASLNDDLNVPWHRVVNAQGKISIRHSIDGEFSQRFLLEEENIEFDSNGMINLKRFQWTQDI